MTKLRLLARSLQVIREKTEKITHRGKYIGALRALIKKDMKKDRLLRGIEYFKNIKPSDFNAAHALHLKVFLNLLEEYLNGGKDDLKEEREIFKDVI